MSESREEPLKIILQRILFPEKLILKDDTSQKKD